jgi:hypothetical protein
MIYFVAYILASILLALTFGKAAAFGNSEA